MLAEFRDWSLFRSGAGWCRKGDRGSMIFMQGKRRGHTNLCTHIRELCYSKEVRGEGQQKMCFTKWRVMRILTWPPPFASALTPLLIMTGPLFKTQPHRTCIYLKLAFIWGLAFIHCYLHKPKVHMQNMKPLAFDREFFSIFRNISCAFTAHLFLRNYSSQFYSSRPFLQV